MAQLHITHEDSSLIQLVTQYASQNDYPITIIEENNNSLPTEPTIIITTNPNYAEQTTWPTLLCSNTAITESEYVTQLTLPTTITDIINHIDTLIAKQAPEPTSTDNTNTFKIGPYKLDPNTRTLACTNPNLFSKHHTIHLTEKEVKLLTRLHQAGEQSVNAQTLLKEIWGYSDSVNTRTLQTHIYRLRQKIDPEDNELSIIITDPTGYRLRES